MARLNVTPERVMMVKAFNKGVSAKTIGEVSGKSSKYVYMLNADPKFRKSAKAGQN